MPPRKKKTSAHQRRKRPQGETSHAVVEALIEATSRLLIEHGYVGTTTNHIAKVAGVSVGSLYQYFSSKQGLVAELGRRQANKAAELFARALETARTFPLRAAVPEVVRTLISLPGDPRLRQQLLEMIPREWTREERLRVEGDVQRGIAEYLRQHDEVDDGDQELRAFVIMHSVQAIIDAAVWQRQDLLAGDALTDELTRLIGRYLERRDA